MENLINFDEDTAKECDIKEIPKNITNPIISSSSAKECPFKHPLLVVDRLSIELNNPFDKLLYRSRYLDDPFECLEISEDASTRNASTISGMSNSSSIEQPSFPSSAGSLLNNGFVQSAESALYSASETINSVTSTGADSHKRSYSESSTISQTEGARSRFHSVDNAQVHKTANQLLKFSLLNSPNSPLHSSSFNNSSILADSVFLEAKKISEKLKSEMSFEDLNNVSSQLIDSSNISLSLVDGDLEQMKISFLESNPVNCSVDTSSEKIEDIQKKLDRIIKKEEVELETNNDQTIKEEPNSPVANATENSSNNSSGMQASNKEEEVDDILAKIKMLMSGNNTEDAKKELQRLNDLISSSESSKLNVPVQQIFRQDTFDIDPETGKRKYCTNRDHSNEEDEENAQSSSNDIVNQLAKLFGTQNLNVESFSLPGKNCNDAQVVVIVPKATTATVTPMKQSNPARRSVSFSSQRPSASALRGIENKKLSTPMKPSVSNSASILKKSSLTAPRSVTKPSSSYDQKKGIGTVRKSLMGSMDKSPAKPKVQSPVKNLKPATTGTAVRRSVSLKSTLKNPSLQVTAPSPAKSRPSITAASATGNTLRVTSTPARRSIAVTPRRTSINVNRPATQKTEFKAPLPSTKLSTKGSLV